jgi:glycosyltransferase involved in cell wall biosynthesis
MTKKIILLSLIGRGGTYHTNVQVSSHLTKYYKTYMLVPTYSETKEISKDVNLIKINAPPSAIKTMFLSLNIFKHIKTIRQINKINPEIIDIMDIHPWYVLYWPFLKAKKVVTINDPELHSGEGGIINGFILRKITRFLLKNASSIIVLGKKQEEIIRKLGYKQKVIVSKIGTYDFLANNKNVPKKSDPKKMLFFGRIKEYKGLKYLLDALLNVKEEYKLIIAGDGDLKPYEKQLEKLEGKVEIYNEFIADTKIAPYFEQSAFLVLPYIDATQTGIVPIAYSFKKAVIATNVGSLPETVINGETGIIIKPKNTKELSFAISSMLNNKEKTIEMGINGYKFMKEELDWNVIVEKLVKELRE